MSSEHVVMRAEHVSKRYRIGAREPYRALRDVISNSLTAPLRRARQGPATPTEYIWALEDISFDVERGDVLGLIGANGAGKSTLLKVLSRITEPTEGQVTIRGRVGSLLEVGTGFHPELTGRENIFLNGTILGMRNAEIRRRFDEIVEFSGMVKFLDTPVKRYSSGMQVRLAFAVAAHLEPEILLVDEVLAVGDAEFQAKCLGKMRDVTREGRTVLFVSHNLGAVRSLCPRALVLEKGKLVFDGDTATGIQRYLGSGVGGRSGTVEGEQLQARLTKSRLYSPTPFFECSRIAVLDRAGAPSTSFRSDEEITIAVDYECFRPASQFRVLVVLSDRDGTALFRTESIDDGDGKEPVGLEPGAYRSSVTIPANLFGDVELDVSVSLVSEVMQVLDFESVLEFGVEFQGHNGNLRSKALLRPALSWQTEGAGASDAPARIRSSAT
jgi:lipopolysaccharide transport system ATP-binding protein